MQCMLSSCINDFWCFLFVFCAAAAATALPTGMKWAILRDPMLKAFICVGHSRTFSIALGLVAAALAHARS